MNPVDRIGVFVAIDGATIGASHVALLEVALGRFLRTLDEDPLLQASADVHLAVVRTESERKTTDGWSEYILQRCKSFDERGSAGEALLCLLDIAETQEQFLRKASIGMKLPWFIFIARSPSEANIVDVRITQRLKHFGDIVLPVELSKVEIKRGRQMLGYPVLRCPEGQLERLFVDIALELEKYLWGVVSTSAKGERFARWRDVPGRSGDEMARGDLGGAGERVIDSSLDISARPTWKPVQ